MGDQPKNVLVALLKELSDFAILETKGWYRIPLQNVPKNWNQEWIAFFQPKVFKEHAYCIEYYGRVAKTETVTRKELFPNELASPKSEKLYLRIQVNELTKREQPIISRIPRRLTFVPTTWEKFNKAELINDIFDDSKPEDDLWEVFKREKIPAERQWEVKVKDRFYYLDFAIFCQRGQLDIEVDSDKFHQSSKEQIDKDYQRSNALSLAKWRPIRFSPRQIHAAGGKYVVQEVERHVNDMGGLNSDGYVPRVFYPEAGGVQQLSLFESQAEYQIDDEYPEFD